ncbi:MAG: hypothetical protein R3F53_30310 [Gammaproteobacteria bacterium]
MKKDIFTYAEEDQERIDAGHGGTLAPKQRMCIAACMAAALIFGNRVAIWLGSSLDRSNEDLALDELPDKIACDDVEILIDQGALKETLSIAGLFKQRDSQHLHFEHQTNAEFLAAWFLIHSGITSEQILNMLCHPSDGHIVPQLHETARIASKNNAVVQYILDTEPQLLLEGDVTQANAAIKARLVHQLLVFRTRKIVGMVFFPANAEVELSTLEQLRCAIYKIKLDIYKIKLDIYKIKLDL